MQEWDELWLTGQGLAVVHAALYSRAHRVDRRRRHADSEVLIGATVGPDVQGAHRGMGGA